MTTNHRAFLRAYSALLADYAHRFPDNCQFRAKDAPRLARTLLNALRNGESVDTSDILKAAARKVGVEPTIKSIRSFIKSLHPGPPMGVELFTLQLARPAALDQNQIREVKESLAGIQLIGNERLRQVSIEGYNATHDDRHCRREIIDNTRDILQSYLNGPGGFAPGPAGDRWGLAVRHNHAPRKLLIIAGALVAAELDRLDRLDENFAPWWSRLKAAGKGLFREPKSIGPFDARTRALLQRQPAPRPLVEEGNKPPWIDLFLDGFSPEDAIIFAQGKCLCGRAGGAIHGCPAHPRQ